MLRRSAMRAYQRGFSLVETIVAIGLLTGALVALAHLIAMTVAANATARHRMLASIAAEQKLEEMRADPTLSDISVGVEHLDAAGAPACSVGVAPCDGVVYVRRWSVEPVAGGLDALLLQVRVRHARYGEVHLVTVGPGRVR